MKVFTCLYSSARV